MQELTKQMDSIKENCNKQTGKFNLSIKLMEKEQKSQGKKIDTILNKLDGLQDKLDKKYANKWTERVLIGFLVSLALVTLYYILESVGLPTP